MSNMKRRTARLLQLRRKLNVKHASVANTVILYGDRDNIYRTFISRGGVMSNDGSASEN